MNLPISNYQFLELLVPVRNITLRTQCLYWCPDHLGMCEVAGIIWYKACNFSIGFKFFSSFYRSSNHSRLSFLEFYISCFELSTSIICTLKLFLSYAWCRLGSLWLTKLDEQMKVSVFHYESLFSNTSRSFRPQPAQHTHSTGWCNLIYCSFKNPEKLFLSNYFSPIAVVGRIISCDVCRLNLRCLASP